MKDKKMVLTRNEIDTILLTLNVRTRTGIKDLRLLKRISDNLKAKLPDEPLPPNPLEGEKHSQEEIDKFNDLNVQFHNDHKEFWKTEEEIEITSMDFITIKGKLLSFKGYYSDEKARNRVLGLADKFEIEGE